MLRLMLWIAIVCLAVSVAAPVMFFMGVLDQAALKKILLVSALGWFVFATSWAVRRPSGGQKSKA